MPRSRMRPGPASAVLAGSLLLGAARAALGLPPTAERLEPTVVLSPVSASPLEQLAAREVRRYFYARTGVLLPIAAASDAPAILVARRDRPAVRAAADAALLGRLHALSTEERLLVTLDRTPPLLLVTGGSEQAVLYAAYRLAEHLGVRFGLHGDTLPDERRGASLPPLDEAGRPLFAIRGIQPFHDLPEGPDWWTRDDYKQVVAQLPKLGMNFLGLHTYPGGRPNAEPTVWIGLPEEIGPGSEVRAAYPSSYFTTQRGNRGYDARATADYTHGAAALFARDAHGNDAMEGFASQPADAAAERALFARAADILRDVFGFARRLGTKTCLGTETPLVAPRAAAVWPAAGGSGPGDSGTTQRLYEGMFRRIAQVHPLDYFWLRTPEAWTWERVKDSDVQATLADVRAALAGGAHREGTLRAGDQRLGARPAAGPRAVRP